MVKVREGKLVNGVTLSAVSFMVMKHDGTQPGPTLGLTEMVGDTVLVAVADEDSDTVVLTELDADFEEEGEVDGDGDGDGLQPVMFTEPESSTRSRPPTMSSSVALVTPVPGPPATVSQLAKAGKPGQAEGTHCSWRQVTYSRDMPPVLYRLTVDRTPPAKAPVGVYVALPEALQVATCRPMTMHPAEVEKLPGAVEKSTASRGFPSTTTFMKPSEKATMIKCQYPSFQSDAGGATQFVPRMIASIWVPLMPTATSTLEEVGVV